MRNTGECGGPFGIRELHGGQVVHDSDVDKLMGVLDHAEDGFQVLGPAVSTQALGERSETQATRTHLQHPFTYSAMQRSQATIPFVVLARL